MDKIAVHVSNREASKRMQEYWFEKGYDWGYLWAQRNSQKVQEELYSCCLYLANSKIFWAIEGEGCLSGYTILTVDEFFAREMIHSKVVTSFTGFTFDGCGFITWQEYDQIGTLRPAEAVPIICTVCKKEIESYKGHHCVAEGDNG